jgi:hypothetical protein
MHPAVSDTKPGPLSGGGEKHKKNKRLMVAEAVSRGEIVPVVIKVICTGSSKWKFCNCCSMWIDCSDA